MRRRRGMMRRKVCRNFDGQISEKSGVINRIRTGIAVLAVVLIVLGLSGCSLIPMWSNDVVYFYSMGVGEWSGENDYTLDYVNDGEYTIIMSRGVGGKRLTKEEALDLKENHTEFELSVDGEAISSDSVRDVDKLGIFGLNGWHVVQEFSIGPLEKDNEYTLIGITRFPDSPEENEIRTNTVNVTIQ